MKKYAGMLVVIVGMLWLATACDELVSEQVSFKNNSASKTVYPIWDGVNMGALAPGQTSSAHTVNPGTHTIQWMNASNNQVLSSIGWPNIAEGSYTQYPYND